MNNREEKILLTDAIRMHEKLTGANDLDQQKAILDGMRNIRTEGFSEDVGLKSRMKNKRWRISWRWTTMAALLAPLLILLVVGVQKNIPILKGSTPPPSLSALAPEISTLSLSELEAFQELAGASDYKLSIQSALRHGYYQPIQKTVVDEESEITLHAAIAEHDLFFLLYTLDPPQGKAVHGLNQLLLQNSATGEELALEGVSDLEVAKQVIAKDLSRREFITEDIGFLSSSLVGRSDTETGRYYAIGIVRLGSNQSFPKEMKVRTHFSLYDPEQMGSSAETIKVQLAKSDFTISLDQEKIRSAPSDSLLIHQDLELSGKTYGLEQVEFTPLEIMATLTTEKSRTNNSLDLISPLLILGAGSETVMLRPTNYPISQKRGSTSRTFHFASNYLDQPEDVQLLVQADNSNEQYSNFIVLDLETSKIVQMPEQLKNIVKVYFLKDKAFELRQQSADGTYYVTDLNTGRLFYEQEGENGLVTYNVHKQSYDPVSKEWTEVYREILNTNEVRFLKIPIEQAKIIRIQ